MSMRIGRAGHQWVMSKYRRQRGGTATYVPDGDVFQFSNRMTAVKKWLNDQKRAAIKKGNTSIAWSEKKWGLEKNEKLDKKVLV